MSTRRTSTPSRKKRRMSTGEIVLAVVGLLVIAAFILGLLASP